MKLSHISWFVAFCSLNGCHLVAAFATSRTLGNTVKLGQTLYMAAEGKTAATKKKKSRSNKKRNANRAKPLKNPNEIQTCRIFGVEVDPDELGSSAIIQGVGDASTVHEFYLSQPVLDSLLKRLKIKEKSETLSLPSQVKAVKVVRRSLDARKKKVLNEGPRYTYVMDVDITKQGIRDLKLKNQPGRMEFVTPDMLGISKTLSSNTSSSSDDLPTVIVVGAGPCGLFCALALAQSKKCKPILIERGQPVESRGKDIGALIHRKQINEESNFAFGEGGAGTWSDGKLTTRIGRNSKNVRKVLETLVEHGAPSKILIDGAPHLGTDNLVKLLRSMRYEIRRLGGEVHFGAKMTNVIVDDEKVLAVDVEHSESFERGIDQNAQKEVGLKETLRGDAVVMATGHSARDVFEELYKAGVELEAKGFAAGFRVEHPQKIINKIQYGNNWGSSAYSGKKVTDDVNTAFFQESEEKHDGILPVSSYRLATDKAFDGKDNRGAYSFCMCPGGQIVPASTQADECCVNGMSFSRRDSVWANAALVCTVAPDDPILDEYREKYGVLAGIEFQREMERRAAIMGGANFTVPVQRLTDFVNGVPSTSAPSSSYKLGVKPSACHEIYPYPMTKALQSAVVDHFEKQMPGFLCESALLHAVETRTSSPVRIKRDPETLQAIGKSGLFPAGEGAGYAGGIVSAAVDGLVVADTILNDMFLEEGVEKSSKAREKSVGFDY